jgi:F0F1-type ATP synthase assembly protein I
MPEENPLLIYGRYAALGFEFAFSTLAGIFVGRYLDGLFGTDPWLMLVGAIAGVAGAISILVNTLQKFSPREHDDRED